MSPRHADTTRQWLAEQAARWMTEHAVDDPLLALRRVLARDGGAPPDRRQWPGAGEIREALQAYQRLFRGNDQHAALQARRRAAVEAMRFFAPFRPALVGAVLDGTADAHSMVQLHVHAEEAEAVLGVLREQGIAHRLGDRRVRLDPRRQTSVPHVAFDADGIGFELWLLPPACERNPPLDAEGRAPMSRASLDQLLRMIDAQPAHPPH